MNVEPSNSCEYDYVQVHEGGDETGNILGRFCGETIPDPVTYIGESLLLEFHSDFSIARPGFSLIYTIGSPTGNLLHS